MATGKMSYNSLSLEKTTTPTTPASNHSILWPDSVTDEFTRLNDAGGTDALGVADFQQFHGWQSLSKPSASLTFNFDGNWAIYTILIRFTQNFSADDLYVYCDEISSYEGLYTLKGIQQETNNIIYSAYDTWYFSNWMISAVEDARLQNFLHFQFYNVKDADRHTHLYAQNLHREASVLVNYNDASGWLDSLSAQTSVTFLLDRVAFPLGTQYKMWGERDMS